MFHNGTMSFGRGGIFRPPWFGSEAVRVRKRTFVGEDFHPPACGNQPGEVGFEPAGVRKTTVQGETTKPGSSMIELKQVEIPPFEVQISPRMVDFRTFEVENHDFRANRAIFAPL